MEMKMHRSLFLFSFLGASTCLAISVIAQERTPPPSTVTITSAASAAKNTTDPALATHSSANPAVPPSKDAAAVESALRIEGEKRFRTNCGRCHMAPHKFPPRVMAAAIRHMRVRAALTDEDMRLILHYMTQ
jgi:mono/diheme cytochrome c family protein